MVISESLGLAKAAGLDVPIVSAIYNCGSAKSWVTELYNPVPGITPSSPASKYVFVDFLQIDFSYSHYSVTMKVDSKQN